MAVVTNTTLSQDMAESLSIEMIENFRGEYDRLAELLGAFSVETRPAGAAINQFKVEGKLNDDATGDASSGDAYVEGDTVALSKYTLKKVPFGELTLKPYRKATSAAAILKAGVEKAVLDTDRKMLSNLRSKVISSFFAALANGTGTAKGDGLQGGIALADAALYDKLEDNNDASDGFVHFISRQDAAEYLASAEVTMQNMFGLTYLTDFLGAQNVFITNKVQKGQVIVTPKENIKIYGVDLAELSRAGLDYVADTDGLLGVAHDAKHENVSVQTHALLGCMFVPEVTDYIVKGTINAKAAAKKE